MTTKHRPLGNYANQKIDEAIMRANDALRVIRPVIDQEMTDLEIIRRVALNIYHVQELIKTLKEIKT